VDHLTWFDPERRPVNALTINEDVAVNNQLASLSHGAGKTSAQNERVKTHLQKLNQCLTG
jgi:hypothetical protein